MHNRTKKLLEGNSGIRKKIKSDKEKKSKY